MGDKQRKISKINKQTEDGKLILYTNLYYQKGGEYGYKIIYGKHKHNMLIEDSGCMLPLD